MADDEDVNRTAAAVAADVVIVANAALLDGVGVLVVLVLDF